MICWQVSADVLDHKRTQYLSGAAQLLSHSSASVDRFEARGNVPVVCGCDLERAWRRVHAYNGALQGVGGSGSQQRQPAHSCDEETQAA